MCINCLPYVRPTKGNDGIRREDCLVKVTTISLSPNLHLNRRMLIKAKQATNQYSISSKVARKILEMINPGPLPTKTLGKILQKQVPPTMNISSVMDCNAKDGLMV